MELIDGLAARIWYSASVIGVGRQRKTNDVKADTDVLDEFDVHYQDLCRGMEVQICNAELIVSIIEMIEQ